jgi:Membrane-associated lipoprotein involved in thiamine biosynthesis
VSDERRERTVWGVESVLVVTDPGMLESADAIAREVISEVDRACSRFRPDSELALLRDRLSMGADVSPILSMLVHDALEAAQLTDGDVDPTLGNDLTALGYDRDIEQLRGSDVTGVSIRVNRHAEPGWTRIRLENGILTVPDDLTLDLGATAKAVAADLAAQRVSDELGCGVLISLGGDIATAGFRPDGPWEILVQDTPSDPGQQVALGDGFGMATSSTQKRRWLVDSVPVHHILDPRFGLPSPVVWKSVTVAAASCLLANAYSTASIVRGRSAVGWLATLGVAARLVDVQNRVITLGGWPEDNATNEPRLPTVREEHHG